MAKKIEIDGKFYRKRRGKLVEIPEKWLGKTLNHQTKNKRLSKSSSRKEKLTIKNNSMKASHPRNWNERHTKGRKKLRESRYSNE